MRGASSTSTAQITYTKSPPKHVFTSKPTTASPLWRINRPKTGHLATHLYAFLPKYRIPAPHFSDPPERGVRPPACLFSGFRCSQRLIASFGFHPLALPHFDSAQPHSHYRVSSPLSPVHFLGILCPPFARFSYLQSEKTLL